MHSFFLNRLRSSLGKTFSANTTPCSAFHLFHRSSRRFIKKLFLFSYKKDCKLGSTNKFGHKKFFFVQHFHQTSNASIRHQSTSNAINVCQTWHNWHTAPFSINLSWKLQTERFYFAINTTPMNSEVSFQAMQEINCKLSLLTWVVQFDVKNHKGKAFNIFHENASMIPHRFSIFTFHNNHTVRSTAPAGFKVTANESSVILLVLVSDWKEYLKATHCCAILREKRQALKNRYYVFFLGFKSWLQSS